MNTMKGVTKTVTMYVFFSNLEFILYSSLQESRHIFAYTVNNTGADGAELVHCRLSENERDVEQ